MSDSPTDPRPAAEARLVALEELFLHLEQTVAALDEVVRRHERTLGQIELLLARLGRQVDLLRTREPDDRDPGDEKPPHY